METKLTTIRQPSTYILSGFLGLSPHHFEGGPGAGMDLRRGIEPGLELAAVQSQRLGGHEPWGVGPLTTSSARVGWAQRGASTAHLVLYLYAGAIKALLHNPEGGKLIAVAPKTHLCVSWDRLQNCRYKLMGS